MKQTLYLYIPAVVLLGLPPRAFSQENAEAFTCPERPDKVAKARKIAGVMFTEAEQAFEDELFDTALEKFVCSLNMVEHENTVTNIERTVAQLTQKATAVALLKAYLAAHPGSEMKSRIEPLIEAAQAEIEAEKEVETEVPCPVAETLPPAPCPEIPEPVLEVNFKKQAQKLAFTTGWAGVGVGAASFITAIVLQALAGSAKNRAQSAVDYDVFLDERDKNRSFQTAATTLFITSVMTSAVGVAELFVLNKQQKNYEKEKQAAESKPASPPSNSPVVSFLPGPGRLEMEVRF